jgi:hypothetical protein
MSSVEDLYSGHHLTAWRSTVLQLTSGSKNNITDFETIQVDSFFRGVKRRDDGMLY